MKEHKQSQSIPKRFKFKMKLDQTIDDLSSNVVVPINDWRETRLEQGRVRKSCENFIKDQKA